VAGGCQVRRRATTAGAPVAPGAAPLRRRGPAAAGTATAVRRRGPVRVSAVATGVVMALAAVAAGSVFGVRPPHAYGVCMACHGRDVLAWTMNAVLGTHLPVAPASVVYPVLTTVGVFAGALLGAVANGEFRWRCPDQPVKLFVYGALVMNGALLAGGCAIRLVLRAAASEPLGLVGVGGLVAGVVLATWWIRWWATR
jgi:hypothetical protein